MASKQSNLDFVLEQLSLDGLSSRKMFGEYGIYYCNRMVALFCDDKLFIRPTAAGRAFIGKVSESAPYPGAKPWFFISGDRCEDGEWLSELVRTTAAELPLPRPKAPKAATENRAKSARSRPLASRRKLAKRRRTPGDSLTPKKKTKS